MGRLGVAKIYHEGMEKRCPNPACPNHSVPRPGYSIKKGYFTTKWNHQPVPRYRCKDCGRCFSSHTFRETRGQHRPDLNEMVLKLYASAMTQRRMAIVLGINRKTVVRKFLFAAALARKEHERRITTGEIKTSLAHFDEMETFEHTRLKPLSVSFAVRAKTGEIIEAQVATMNCKGPLAEISRRKYGWRRDTRPIARKDVLQALGACSRARLTIVTDKHPDYPKAIRKSIPGAEHMAVKRTAPVPPSKSANRKNENDPMFTLNYTAAKIRHDLSRMARKVWVTTKKKQRLQAHLDLYIAWNNAYHLPA
jgi:transposase-like protein